jgi:hypothetical protein
VPQGVEQQAEGFPAVRVVIHNQDAKGPEGLLAGAPQSHEDDSPGVTAEGVGDRGRHVLVLAGAA